MSANGDKQALRVAVVGSGPAGFYAAGALLGADVPVEVDLIERLPTPWGLVRLGVAPDHPKIKSVSRAFERIAERPGFRFLGNVEIGRDLHHADLARLYDAVVYSVGAQTDRQMGIPGEDLPGSWAATELVAWYNGHPDYQELDFALERARRVVVVGAGNVALDVVRMLALTPEELSPTDTTDAAIAAICGAGIEEIVMVARRGPAQGAFTTPELSELGELEGADVLVDPAELEGAEPKDTNAERNLEVLRGYAAREPQGKPKRIVLRFFRSPVTILGDERVEGVELVRNELDENERPVPTDERETLSCELVFRSVGYRGVALPEVPFDERRGTIPNERGRVLGPDGEPLAGVYCAGWIKRGPSGVIGTNKKDATETVELLLEDAAAGRLERKPEATAAAVDALLAERGVGVVEYVGWAAIDAVERAAGEKLGRPRVKLCTWDELLAAAERAASRSA
ncbi:MAG TPA: FAD-dependent oxidoreductase [Gaiellaceae bacterium]|jgi:ferredoxin--NADP+ reductase|nr:FAD-dependent oxidoreductase [Gaiellaceae bacterium]